MPTTKEGEKPKRIRDLITDVRGIDPTNPGLDILITSKKPKTRINLGKFLTQSLDPADKSEEKQG